MSFVTCAVTMVVKDQTGTPVAFANVAAILDRVETDNDFVIPRVTKVQANSLGEVILPLWPNQRGKVGSAYTVIAYGADGRRFFNEVIVVYDLDSSPIEALIDAPRFPALETQEQAAADVASFYAAQAADFVFDGQAAVAATALNVIAAQAAQSGAEAAADLTADLAAGVDADAAAVAAQVGVATTKANEAATSASNAATSAGNAASSAVAAAASGVNAANSAATATTKAGEASTSASNAATSASTATTKAGEASTSANSAANSAATATTKASEAATSAGNALSSANNSAASAAASASSSASANTAAFSAGNSASQASSSANNAANSASQAGASATTATTKASEAVSSANSAAASASTATTKASEASASASTATTKASEAATSAGQAATSATNASNSAGGAATSAATASTKASEAATSASNAATSASTATTKASEASASASNAASSAATATTKASEASASASSASSSAATATTKASEASTSASNAAASASSAASESASASGFADSAQISANSAATSKTAAEVASAIVGSYVGMYEGITAGLAAVTDGQYFSTPGASTAEYSILYRRTNSTTAQEIAKYPSSISIGDILKAIVFGNPDGYVFTVLDEAKRAAIGITEDGTLEVANLLARVVTITEALTQLQLKAYDLFLGDNVLLTPRYVKPGFLIDIQDASGNTVIALKEDGTLAVASLELLGGAVGGSESSENFSAEINHVLENGQSLSEGHSAQPVLTTSQRFDSLRFNGGVRAKDAGEANDTEKANARATFVPLVETSSGVLGESPCSGMSECIKERIVVEDNITFGQQNYQMFMSCPGEGGQSLASLNNTYYHRVYNDIFYGVRNARTLGKTYRLQAMTWAQGEEDDANKTDPASYKVALKAYIARVNADLFTLTGQKTPLKFITYQPVSHEIQSFGMDGTPRTAIALAEFADEDANAYLACPNYMFPRAADNGHFTNVGSKWFGAYFGMVYKRVIIDGGTWEPLKPKRIYFDDKVAMVEFIVTRPPLVFDTTTVAAHPTRGFRVVDPDGAEVAISSVAIVNRKYVKITCATAIPVGSVVQYAYKSESTNPNRNGPINGPRGNLRDSQGDDIVFDPTGINKRLDNWCILFSKKAT